MYFANPSTASFEPRKMFGAIGVSTSATIAIWISLSVTPTSVAFGFSVLLLWPEAGPAVSASDTPTVAKTAASATQRVPLICSPLISVDRVRPTVQFRSAARACHGDDLTRRQADGRT